MNTGAEAVETAIKAARKWAYKVKGVPDGPRRDHRRRRQLPRPHDDDRRLLDRRRSTATASARSRPASSACRSATPRRSRRRSRRNTAAFLVEPIQGEAGIIVPPAGYLARVREICTRAQRAADLRRDPDGPRPHRRACSPASTRASGPTCSSLGKALGGGLLPVSRVLRDARSDGACSSPATTAAPSAAIRSRAAVGAGGARRARRRTAVRARARRGRRSCSASCARSTSRRSSRCAARACWSASRSIRRSRARAHGLRGAARARRADARRRTAR